MSKCVLLKLRRSLCLAVGFWVLGTDYFRASRPVIVRTDGGLLSVSPRIGGTVTGYGEKVVMKCCTLYFSDLASNKSIRLQERSEIGR
jgi:hypothetical protein